MKYFFYIYNVDSFLHVASNTMMHNIHFVPLFIFCIQWLLNTVYKISTNNSAALSSSNS